ncbi:MAG: hypothetical protein QOD03_795 [Verrucomicrobiota bacterium]
MKPENPNDPILSKLLREWKNESPLPPRFNEQVWHRIALEDSAPAHPLLFVWKWLTQSAMRPSFAAGYATILLCTGLTAGLWQAHESSQRASETLSARYVQMVDPYQMPRH